MAHAHEHTLKRTHSQRVLVAALSLTAVFAAVEVVAGAISHSLALMADGGHMFGDALAIGLSLFALWLAGRPTTPHRTYGFSRAEILAAQVNGAVLAGIAVWTIWNAVMRLMTPAGAHAGPMIVVAALGVLVNMAVAAVLLDAGRESLNVRGALLDAASDALGAGGTVAAGVVIALTGWQRADAVASLLISALILIGAWRLLREVVNVLLEGTPRGVSLTEVGRAMLDTPGVAAVHDVHIWTVTSGFVALSTHVEIDGTVAEHAVLDALTEALAHRFNIVHATIQLEPAGHVTDHCEVGCEPERVAVVHAEHN